VSNELLEKVITTTTVGSGGGGLLAPAQADRFIDYMWDQTVLGKDARTVRLRANTAELDKIGVGQRIMRVATEAVDDHVNVGVTFSKISITTTKLRLDWELSSESLEDNLEGEALEDHIARLMATQAGNDLEDVAINGDTTSADPLLKAFDGWKKQANAAGHVVDAAGATLGKAVFNTALKAMPRYYKQRRNQLRFYAGSNLIQDYIYALVNTGPADIQPGLIRGDGLGVNGAPGNSYPFAFGIPVVEVPMFSETLSGDYSGATGDHGYLELTFPQNRIWAVKREIQVFREFKPKKDTIEYTVYTRCGVAIEDFNAYVVIKNVKVAS
jgi:hypothetical protein